ncbi:MAG: ZIP family metal transporter [Candidatus Falkowbacteria bacterium]
MILIYIIGSVVLVSLISLVGAVVLLKRNFLESKMLYLVSFSVGALLGDVFIHIMPELAATTQLNFGISIWILIGLLIFFVLEKFIFWHHCHRVDAHKHARPVGYAILVGDGLHNFIDGAIIAGAYLVSVPLGIATTLAVVLHEIPQEIGDLGVLVYAGFTKARALLFNLLSGLIAVIGAILTIAAAKLINGLEPILLAVAAGGFIYIAGSDLIPELHKEIGWKKSTWQLITIILGISVMAGLLLIE